MHDGATGTTAAAGLSERERNLLRLLCRGQTLERIIIDWTGPHAPTDLEIACLQNRWAARIASLRKVWTKRKDAQ